jgi:hypothetical protein
MKAQERSTIQENRRGFVRHCFGAGASLVALPIGSSQAVGSVQSSSVSKMSEYERILSHTKTMHILGNPRSWSLVTQGFRPFAPERVVVMWQQNYGDRCGRDLRRQIDKQIQAKFGDWEGFGKKWFPDSKLESIYWMMDAMCGHYGVPYLEQWVVGLAGREILASTAWSGMGMAHQYQHGGPVPVDNPPYDWWLFLFPEGLEWAAMNYLPIFAVICHVGKYGRSSGAMLPLWALTQKIWTTVPEWSKVAQMGRVDACRHLNGIAAQCLANKPQ